MALNGKLNHAATNWIAVAQMSQAPAIAGDAEGTLVVVGALPRQQSLHGSKSVKHAVSAALSLLWKLLTGQVFVNTWNGNGYFWIFSKCFIQLSAPAHAWVICSNCSVLLMALTQCLVDMGLWLALLCAGYTIHTWDCSLPPTVQWGF